jgi:phosphoribosyl 1,2-cyclic phosphate phosphodiesterase
MKVQILGTAAAEGWPALFCQCDTCNKARELGGKDIRSRSSLMIDDQWKVDFPPDGLYHVQKHNLDFAKLRHLFFTHSHEDHMDSEDLTHMNSYFCKNNFEKEPLNIYLTKEAMSQYERRVGNTHYGPVAEIHFIKPFEPVQAGEMMVTPLLADHTGFGENEKPVFYIFENKDHCILYATDTGPFPEPSWEVVLTKKFDLIVSECTMGISMGTWKGHMMLGDVVRTKQRLLEAGSIQPDCPFWTTHFTHNSHALHADYEAAANPHGIEVGYDGVIINL